MTNLISFLGAIFLLIAFVTFFVKANFHFQYIRKKEKEKATFSDLINVSFSNMSVRMRYIESSLPIPITEKQEDEKMEKLRKNVNQYLAISIVSFILFIISFYISV